MYCRTCGNKVNDNAEICVKCGCKPLIGKGFCQNCGTKTTAQQVMCTKCKATLKSIAPKSNQQQISKGKSTFGKTLKVLGVIFLVLMIIKTAVGFISGEYIYKFIYEPSFFFDDMGMTLICLIISIIFIVLGKRLGGGKRK